MSFSYFVVQSEDEALALAIQASLSESSPQDKTSTSLTQQEEEDRALAQAIADSERLTHESRGQRLTVNLSFIIVSNFYDLRFYYIQSVINLSLQKA